MIERAVTTVIDRDKCIGCGECVRVCPSQTLEMKDGKAVVTGVRSIACGHCVCRLPGRSRPVWSALDPDSLRFQHLCAANGRGCPTGAFDTANWCG